jgi:hypothetical protein
MVELRHPAVAAGERVEEVADGVLAEPRRGGLLTRLLPGLG